MIIQILISNSFFKNILFIKTILVLGVSTLFFSCTNTSAKEELVLRNYNELGSNHGKKVVVEGIYTLYNPFPAQKGKAEVDIVQIKLEGEDGPFLEVYWDKNSVRSEEEVAKFNDKKVKVWGVYHKEQPKQPNAPDQASSFGGSCISPVDSIALLD